MKDNFLNFCEKLFEIETEISKCKKQKACHGFVHSMIPLHCTIQNFVTLELRAFNCLRSKSNASLWVFTAWKMQARNSAECAEDPLFSKTTLILVSYKNALIFELVFWVLCLCHKGIKLMSTVSDFHDRSNISDFHRINQAGAFSSKHFWERKHFFALSFRHLRCFAQN